jgi:hypothetical protein
MTTPGSASKLACAWAFDAPPSSEHFLRSMHSRSGLTKGVRALRTRSMISRKVSIAGLLAFLMIAPLQAGTGQKGRPLTESDLLRLLAGGVYCSRVSTLVRERGIAFSPTKRDIELLQHAGADEELRGAVIAAQQTSPSRDTVEPTDAKPSIVWHRVDGSWRWHCVAHCSKYRRHSRRAIGRVGGGM